MSEREISRYTLDAWVEDLEAGVDFGLLAAQAVSGLLGVLTPGFLAQRLFCPPPRDKLPAPPWVGRSCSTAGSCTSFVAHARGPPMYAYLLPLRLDPRVVSGTMTVFFGVNNAVKLVPCMALGLMDLRNLATSLLLMPVSPLGVWVGVWLVRRGDATWFYRLAYMGILLTGLKLLSDAFRWDQGGLPRCRHRGHHPCRP